MDLHRAIQDLCVEKKRLERVIASLEELQRTGAGLQLPKGATRRGRRSMGASERAVVSERMKKYWASRRKAGAQDSRATD